MEVFFCFVAEEQYLVENGSGDGQEVGKKKKT